MRFRVWGLRNLGFRASGSLSGGVEELRGGWGSWKHHAKRDLRLSRCTGQAHEEKPVCASKIDLP